MFARHLLTSNHSCKLLRQPYLSTSVLAYYHVEEKMVVCLRLRHGFASVGLILLLILSACRTASADTQFPSPDLRPLFDEATDPSIQLLHTSLATLLPILPLLSPAPSHTLLVTLVTPAFKSLFYNWMCWLRYRVKWGEEYDDEPSRAEIPKFLVVTSDEDMALELVGNGIVVWWLKARSVYEVNAAETGETGRMEDDLFTSLRALDLLLSPGSEERHDPRQQMLPWGSLHYQSLMLERTLVMSVLVGALAESQKVAVEDRKRVEIEWRKKFMAHDWESSLLRKDPFVGVKGVLVVDNDAVWYGLVFLG